MVVTDLLLMHPMVVLIPLIVGSLLLSGMGVCCATEEERRHPFLQGVRDIHVDIPLTRERILVGVEEKRYRPLGLEARSSYELRVSYVSSHSVQIRFGYACDTGSLEDTKPRQGRKLMNAEKIVFTTDGKAGVTFHSCGMTGGSGVLLTMSVHPWGIMRHVMNESYFEYDVVLEKNHLGVPVSSVPVLVMALCLVGFLLVVGVGWWMRMIHPWYTSSESETTNHKDT